MVIEEHEIARLEFLVDCASCIGEQKRLDSVFSKDADWKCNRLKRMPFVIMRPAHENEGWSAGKFSDRSLSGVTEYPGFREPCELGVGNCAAIFQCVCYAGKAATEHNGKARSQFAGAANEGGSGFRIDFTTHFMRIHSFRTAAVLSMFY